MELENKKDRKKKDLLNKSLTVNNEYKKKKKKWLG